VRMFRTPQTLCMEGASPCECFGVASLCCWRWVWPPGWLLVLWNGRSQMPLRGGDAGAENWAVAGQGGSVERVVERITCGSSGSSGAVGACRRAGGAAAKVGAAAAAAGRAAGADRGAPGRAAALSLAADPGGQARDHPGAAARSAAAAGGGGGGAAPRGQGAGGRGRSRVRVAGGGAGAQPVGRGAPSGRLRHGPDRQALPVGRCRAQRRRLLRADAGCLPQRRDLPAEGEPRPVVRRPARRPRRAGPATRCSSPTTCAPSTIHHVGMYIGGGAMVEAPYTGARVCTASIGRRDYIGAVRPTS
jgi:hypothetical protein